MTGQHNFRNYKSFGVMDPNEKPFGHMLQRAGYKTCIAPKWQLFSYDVQPSKYRATGKRPEQGGFDEFLLWHDALSETKGNRYGPGLFSDYLIDFLARHRHTPFFAYYPMASPTAPSTPPPSATTGPPSTA